MKDRLGVLDEDIEGRFRKLPEEEIQLYEGSTDRKMLDLLLGVLQGHTLTKMTKNDMDNILDHMVNMDLGFLPDTHLYYFIKWVGTSVARKFATRRCQSVAFRLFTELSKRKSIREVLLSRKPKSSQLFGGGANEKSYSYEELAKTTLGMASINQAYASMFSSEESLYMHFDILVSFSNLNIYLEDYSESIKYLLTHAIVAHPTNQAIHTMVYLKITNIIWAMMKVSPKPDSVFNNLALSFYKDMINSSGFINRLMNYLWLLSIQYTLTSNKPDPLLIKTTQSALAHYSRKMQYRDNMVYNSKNSYLICQIMLSLFKEIGPHLRMNTLNQAKIDKNNPFKEHFSKMEEFLRPALWIIMENMKCKQGETGLSLTYLEGFDRNLLISKDSVFSNATHSLEKKLSQLLGAIEGVKTIEMNVMIGFYEVDILINGNTVINCESAFHYLYGRRDKLIIPNMIKENHLKALGVKNQINLDYDIINENRTDLLDYLRTKLTNSF